MKDGLKEIIGKRVVGVVVARSDVAPSNQVFLAFDDGSSFELYGDNFTCGGGLDRARDIERYVASGRGRIIAVYGDAERFAPARATLSTGREELPYPAGAPESLEELLRRDLSAWIAAKSAVEKARRS